MPKPRHREPSHHDHSRSLRLAAPALAALALLVPLLASAADLPAAPGTSGSLATLVAVVMGFGGLGGFVDGLTSDVVYRVNFGARSLDIGSFGDILAGATAAIAIFTVGKALFPEIALKSFGADLDDSIRVIAISVLSGYAGVRLLNPLTRKLVEQISTDKAQEVGRSIRARDEDLIIAIKDGDKALNDYSIVPTGDVMRAAATLERAQKHYEIALKRDPLDTEALLGMAKVARRRAQLHESQNESGEAEWDEALRLLDRITSSNPRAARAFYNKACYKQIRQRRGGPSTEAMEDLKRALELQPELRARAASDEDLVGLQRLELFKTLVGAVTSDTTAAAPTAVA